LPFLLPAIRRSRLFAGLDAEEVMRILPCLGAGLASYGEGEYVLRVGESTACVHLVVGGEVHVVHEDWWGNRNIVSSVRPGSSFAESYACVPGVALPVSVVAVKASTVVRLDARRILAPCSEACPFHMRLMENLVADIAEKNLRLSRKLRYLSLRSTRGKLLAYLSDESARAESSTFDVPFTRQQLADYLSVNRSAMSGELCRMRDEGIVAFERNHFALPGRRRGDDSPGVPGRP
jgi:CRP-like cAMP-binding protein